VSRSAAPLLVLALALGWPRPGAATPAPRTIEVSKGIYLFITAPYSDVGLDGNAVAIVSDSGVLVFDANGTPGAARAVLAEIRRITRQPVRYLVFSHWHWDHWYGAEVYKDAFPEVEIISHRVTRALMLGPALAFNQPGLDTQLPAHIRAVAARIGELEQADPRSPDLPRLRAHLAEDRDFLAEKRAARHTVATLTFDDSLTIHLGGRRIEVLHYDRAVTPGDAFLYLPDEQVLITGDLLVNPITFALGCYPEGWIATLAKMDALPARVVVPGHGEPLHDKALLETTLATLRELRRLGLAARARGLGADSARAAIMDSIRPLMVRITHDDPALDRQFATYLVDWYLHRVYDEAAGPLTDSIAAIPQE
jgi:glyoxylase-like metal-dependent hydrolase (beta-lactamase superfamily II)